MNNLEKNRTQRNLPMNQVGTRSTASATCDAKKRTRWNASLPWGSWPQGMRENEWNLPRNFVVADVRRLVLCRSKEIIKASSRRLLRFLGSTCEFLVRGNLPGGLLGVMALVIACHAEAASAETNALVAAWLAAQTNVHAWSARLVQTRTLKALEQPLVSTGRVWFAAPNRFHWELGDPPQTIAVRQAQELWVIYPDLKRAERYPLAGAQAGRWRELFALFEAGFPRSQSEMTATFRINSQTISNDVVELALQPRAAGARRMMPQIKVAFETNRFSLRATEMQFADGSKLRNDFTNAEMNPQIDERLFEPRLGPDFQVVEPLKKK